MNKIYFQSKSAPEYRFLSNFHMQNFSANWLIWKSVEHYYQAMKMRDWADVISVMNASTPKEAKHLAYKFPTEQGWEDKKIKVMIKGVWAKFSQNKDLKQKILATGDAELIEFAPWGDTFWGVNSKYEGENNLGKILMKTREKLRETK